MPGNTSSSTVPPERPELVRQPRCVAQQNFVVADLDEGRRKVAHVGIDGRDERQGDLFRRAVMAGDHRNIGPGGTTDPGRPAFASTRRSRTGRATATAGTPRLASATRRRAGLAGSRRRARRPPNRRRKRCRTAAGRRPARPGTTRPRPRWRRDRGSPAQARTPAAAPALRPRGRCGSPCAGANHSRQARKHRHAGTGSASRRVLRAAPAIGIESGDLDRLDAHACGGRHQLAERIQAKARCVHVLLVRGRESVAIAKSPRARCAPCRLERGVSLIPVSMPV